MGAGGSPGDAALIASAMLLSATVATLATRATLSAPRGRSSTDETGTARLQAVLDALPQPAAVVTADSLRIVNPAACAQLGLDAARLGDIHPASLFADSAAAAAALGPTVFDGPAVLRRPDGTDMATTLLVRPLPGTSGERLFLIDSDTVASRMAVDLESQREELKMLTRRLMTLQEDERAALSRELHDDVGQAITAIKLCASALHGPGTAYGDFVAETAQEIAQIADQTVVKLRDLSLLLRPPQLDALGLEAALRWQAGRLFRSGAPALSLDIEPLDCRPPREVELACFRIAQEALTNVLRHARASNVRLRLFCDETSLRLRVEDDGAGMAADRCAGLGLVTMRERAQQLGGTFAIDSDAAGTRIDVALPLGEPPRA